MNNKRIIFGVLLSLITTKAIPKKPGELYIRNNTTEAMDIYRVNTSDTVGKAEEMKLPANMAVNLGNISQIQGLRIRQEADQRLHTPEWKGYKILRALYCKPKTTKAIWDNPQDDALITIIDKEPTLLRPRRWDYEVTPNLTKEKKDEIKTAQMVAGQWAPMDEPVSENVCPREEKPVVKK